MKTSQLTPINRRTKHLACTLNHFWKRWRTEYLTKLRKSHRQSTHDCSTKPPIKEGDVVVVHDESLPRGLWKLGRIQEIITEDLGGHSESCFKETSAAPVTPTDTAVIPFRGAQPARGSSWCSVWRVSESWICLLIQMCGSLPHWCEVGAM